MQEERILTINGEVNYPGVYDYADGTTIETLILQAGGLKDAASLVKVDVSRRLRNNEASNVSSQVAQAFSLSLKDGFVVDGQPGFVLQHLMRCLCAVRQAMWSSSMFRLRVK